MFLAKALLPVISLLAATSHSLMPVATQGLCTQRCSPLARRAAVENASGDATANEDDDTDMDALRELFVEAVQKADGGAQLGMVGDEKTASLEDLDEAHFKLLMLRRLGQDDYNKIFRNPRVDLEIG